MNHPPGTPPCLEPCPKQVEKAHANVQVDLKSEAHNFKRHQTIQQDSFVMSVCLEHSRLKSAVEEEVFGKSKRKVFRCLRSRLVESTAPGATLSSKKQRFSSLGKRHPGIVSGIALVRCGQVRKTHVKTRRLSAYNAFQSVCKQLAIFMQLTIGYWLLGIFNLGIKLY